MIIKPEKGKRIVRLDAACSHPKVSPDEPIEVEVLIESEPAMKFCFTNCCLKTLEYDLGRTSQIRSLFQEEDYIVMEIRNSATFVPAEFYPNLTNQTYNVGAFIGKVTFHEKQTLPSEEYLEIEEPETEETEETDVEIAPAAEVKEETKKEIDVPKETIFGDKVGEEELDETLKEMSNFELELPQ